MGLSSLVFGGLTLLQARNASDDGNGASSLSFRETLLQAFQAAVGRLQHRFLGVFAFMLDFDTRTLLSIGLSVVIILTLAHLTKPSDASFRSYLSDLSLHHHLRHLRDQQQLSHDHSANGFPSTSSREAGVNDHPEQSATWLNDAASPHVLTFANRICISLRTPIYRRRDCGLFVLVTVQHSASPCLRSSGATLRQAGGLKSPPHSTCPHCGAANASAHQKRHSWFIGAFGNWWHGVKEVPSLRLSMWQRPIKVGDAKEYGVLGMRSHDEDTRHRASIDSDHSNGQQKAAQEEDEEANVVSGSVAHVPKGLRRKKNTLRLRGVPGAGPNPTASARSSAIAAQRIHLGGAVSVEEGSTSKPVHVSAVSSQPAGESASSAIDTLDSLADEPSGQERTAIDAAVADLQQQLTSLKVATESTQQQLHTQLEELRARKREEDAMRSDLKGRMKTLDEGRRLSEAAKRDAEKRLRSAQTMRESLQKRSDAARTALSSFKERERSCVVRLEEARQKRSVRQTEIEQELEEKRVALKMAEKALSEAQLRATKLEERVAQEQSRVKTAEQTLSARMTARAQEAAFASSGVQAQHHAQSPQQQAHAGVTLPYAGAAHLDDPSGGFRSDVETGEYQNQDYYHSGELDGPYWMHPSDGDVYSSLQSMSRRASEDARNGTAPHHGVGDVAGPMFSHGRSFAPGEFESSIMGSPFLTQQPLPANDRSLLHATRQMRSLRDLSDEYQQGSRQTNLPPPSPFSTDLLPSNLFQSADDDTHPGVLAGRGSPTLEAALNRFGLASSDRSSLDDNQSEHGTVDEVLDGNLQPLSEHDSEGEQSAPLEPASQKSSRSWWGSKSRQQSKDRAITADVSGDESLASDNMAGDSNATDSSNIKRRSFGVFPRLSLNPLNPGARVFRSAARKQADTEALRGMQPSGFGSEGYLGPPGKASDWDTRLDRGSAGTIGSSNVGHSSQRTPFDAVLRAFETSHMPDEEEGRRSWSAFDQWSQRQGLSARHNLVDDHGTPPLGSSTPVIPSGLGQESFNGWPEDLFQPLGRSSSAGASIESSAASSRRGKTGAVVGSTDTSSIAPSSSGSVARERPNRSRFAFWSQNSKGSLNSTGSASEADTDGKESKSPDDRQAASTPTAIPAASHDLLDAGNSSNSPGKAIVGSLGAASTSSANSSTNGAANSSRSMLSNKRRSFRWPRRQNSSAGRSSASVSAASDHEEG
ncbi:unnamed protein product [Parajaminaea phylloscopi]